MRLPKALRSIWVLVGSGALALIVAGLMFSSDPSRVFSLKGGAGKVEAGGAGPETPKQSGLLGASGLDPAGPTLHFAQTRMGQVLFSAANTDLCKRVLFDNTTGTSYWTRSIDCARPIEEAEVSEKPDRFLAVQKSFKR